MAFTTSEILVLFVYFSKMYTQGGVQELIRKKKMSSLLSREANPFSPSEPWVLG